MITKTAAGYKTNVKVRQCRNCKHFFCRRCDIVRGEIYPKSTCRYWKKK